MVKNYVFSARTFEKGLMVYRNCSVWTILEASGESSYSKETLKGPDRFLFLKAAAITCEI